MTYPWRNIASAPSPAGSDSLCEVTVRVAKNGGKKTMSIGKAVGTDIVQTSVDATMEALDRLYCRKKE